MGRRILLWLGLAAALVGGTYLARHQGDVAQAQRAAALAAAAPWDPDNPVYSGGGPMRLNPRPPADWRARNVPTECFRTLRHFWDSALSYDVDLVHDRETRERFFTSDFSQGFERFLATFVYPEGEEPGPEYPNNKEFLIYWEPPDEVALLGARRYDATVLIDFLFMPGRDQNYAGEYDLVTYLMIWNGAQCLIDNSFIFHNRPSHVTQLRWLIWKPQQHTAR